MKGNGTNYAIWFKLNESFSPLSSLSEIVSVSVVVVVAAAVTCYFSSPHT